MEDYYRALGLLKKEAVSQRDSLKLLIFIGLIFSHIFTYNISTRHKRKDVKPVHSAIDIANFFIDITQSKEEGYLSDLKVNKLLYFAQAWSLVRLGRPLFDESIEAWPLGPVVPNVYNAFKSIKATILPKCMARIPQTFFSDEGCNC